MDQNLLREKLNAVLDAGLSAKAVARYVGIGNVDISRFRNGNYKLKAKEEVVLSDYLDKVVIPVREFN